MTVANERSSISWSIRRFKGTVNLCSFVTYVKICFEFIFILIKPRDSMYTLCHCIRHLMQVTCRLSSDVYNLLEFCGSEITCAWIGNGLTTNMCYNCSTHNLMAPQTRLECSKCKRYTILYINNLIMIFSGYGRRCRGEESVWTKQKTRQKSKSPA